jgi:predicted porin
MKNMRVTQRILGPLVAGGLMAALAAPASAVDVTTADGAWTFSVSGEINVDYIFSSCQSPSNAAVVQGGLTCVGTSAGNDVSNIGNGLLPASIAFGVKTTQNGIDIGAHFGFFPGIATNDGGSPNLQASGGPTNVALGTTGLDVRQVYLTFGTKEAGTVLMGRNIGLFAADVILADMTLIGIGAPGSAAGPAPSNTTLGGIGFGYIYTDWLSQIDYTTPDFSGFNVTVGAFDPLNSLSEPNNALVTTQTQPKKAPGFHAKATFTMPINDTTKLYVSVSGLTQKQYYAVNDAVSGVEIGQYNYTGNGGDIFAKLDIADFEVFGYYYDAKGLGTTALFNFGAYGLGQTRKSDGFMAQMTYKLGDVKLGVNYGESKLDHASDPADVGNPFLVANNKKGTIGAYWSLTKNLTLLAEATETKSSNQAGNDNKSNTFNIGAYVGF